MDEQTKDMLDVAAGSTAILTMAAWLPPIASAADDRVARYTHLRVRHCTETCTW